LVFAETSFIKKGVAIPIHTETIAKAMPDKIKTTFFDMR